MSRLSKYHPSVYFSDMDKYHKRFHLNYYNNKSITRKKCIKLSHKIWDDEDIYF